MHTFGALGPNFSNSDGVSPSGLVMAGGKIYGIAGAGIFGSGLVFSIETNSSNYSVLYYFNALSGSFPGTNRDGAYPGSGLVFAENTLYGTTQAGGDYGYGTIFKIGLDGSNFTTLHTFDGGSNSIPPYAPGLFISGNKIYGTTASGGNSNGTVFSINIDGSAFSNLYTFTGSSPPGYEQSNTGTNSDGSYPGGSVIYADGNLYGAVAYGGLHGSGTIYSLQLEPPRPSLSIFATNHQFAVSWPLTASNFTLQISTNLFATNWNSITSGITTIGINSIFTNQISGLAAFFRLRSQ